MYIDYINNKYNHYTYSHLGTRIALLPHQGPSFLDSVENSPPH